MTQKLRKYRVYQFTAESIAVGPKSGAFGTVSLIAKSADEAERLRAEGNGSKWRCAGYLGPVHYAGWKTAAEIRTFVTAEEAERERRAAMPEVDHDPEMLAEFVADRGCQPKRGNVLVRALMTRKVVEIEPDCPAYLDPSCESYYTA